MHSQTLYLSNEGWKRRGEGTIWIVSRSYNLLPLPALHGNFLGRTHGWRENILFICYCCILFAHLVSITFNPGGLIWFIYFLCIPFRLFCTFNICFSCNPNFSVYFGQSGYQNAELCTPLSKFRHYHSHTITHILHKFKQHTNRFTGRAFFRLILTSCKSVNNRRKIASLDWIVNICRNRWNEQVEFEITLSLVIEVLGKVSKINVVLGIFSWTGRFGLSHRLVIIYTWRRMGEWWTEHPHHKSQIAMQKHCQIITLRK